MGDRPSTVLCARIDTHDSNRTRGCEQIESPNVCVVRANRNYVAYFIRSDARVYAGRYNYTALSSRFQLDTGLLGRKGPKGPKEKILDRISKRAAAVACKNAMDITDVRSREVPNGRREADDSVLTRASGPRPKRNRAAGSARRRPRPRPRLCTATA